MANAKSKKILGVIAVVILIVSLVVALIDALIPLNFWTHPALNFLFSVFTGFGLLSLAFGIKSKRSWFAFIGDILLGLSVLYVLMQYLTWWISLIAVFVFWISIGIIGYMILGNKTEIVDNDNPEYKNYELRKAEKLEKEKNKEPEELPEIKSFK